MQRRPHDATFTAIHAAGHLASDAVDIVVISADEALITALREAAGTDTVHHAFSADAAVDLLVGGRCGVLVADLALLRSDAFALLERLHTQFPELVLLAAGGREKDNTVAALVSKCGVYRYLHKPISPARASLFLSAAVRRYHESVSGRSPTLTTVRQLAQPANRNSLILGTGIAAALALMSVGLFLLRPAGMSDRVGTNELAVATAPAQAPSVSTAFDAAPQALDARHDETFASADAKQSIDDDQMKTLDAQVAGTTRAAIAPAATPNPTTPAAADVGRSERNIRLARARLDSGHWLAPTDDSALAYLREARARNEDPFVVSILATDLGSRLIDRSRAAMDASDAAQARAHYDDAIRLDREFDLALPGLAEAAEQLDALTSAESNRGANEVRDLLAPAIRLRESGQLIEPAGRNAYEAIKSLLPLHGDASELRAEQQRLVFTLLDHARTAFAAGDLERADLLAQRADDLVPGMSATQALRDQVAVAIEKRAAEHRRIDAARLHRTREIPATYPPDARNRKLEGWVDLEFIIAANGATRDIAVKVGEPARIFDEAAVDALRRWRFEPILGDDEQPIDQRARLRMQFTLK
jgi:TonB family protein